MDDTLLSQLTIGELADLVDGRLRLGSLPPLDGRHQPLGPLATRVDDVQPGDVFWALDNGPDSNGRCAEAAFAAGASGAVVSGRPLEPWAGTFAVEVADCELALWTLAALARRRLQGQVIGVYGTADSADRTTRLIARMLASRFQVSSWPSDRRSAVGLSRDVLDWRLHDDFTIVALPFEEKLQIEPNSHLCCSGIAVITTTHNSIPNGELLRQVVRLAQPGIERCDGFLVVDSDHAAEAEPTLADRLLRADATELAVAERVPEQLQGIAQAAWTVGRLCGVNEQAARQAVGQWLAGEATETGESSDTKTPSDRPALKIKQTDEADEQGEMTPT